MRILNISPINFVSNINFKKKEIENPISKDTLAQNEAPSAIDSYGRAVVQKRNNIKICVHGTDYLNIVDSGIVQV